MITNGAERLFPNENIYQNNVEISSSLINCIDQIPNDKLGKTEIEQQEARLILKNWVTTLVQGLEFALRIQNLSSINSNQVEEFKLEFEKKLIEFINHKDHGILHSFYVYKGMLYLAEQNSKPIVIGSEDDKQAQLLALFHDINQTLPFTLEGSRFSRRYSHQKNGHAKIVSDMTKIFGRLFGFSKLRTKQLAYGLEHHDVSYDDDKVQLIEDFDYLSQLLHDSDKIFGATLLDTDVSFDELIETITIAMLDRNYQANKGEKGSYLFRQNLDSRIRDIIKYGDRCLADAISLVRKEFNLQMCTPAAKQIVEQRKAFREKAIDKVYSKYFLLTQKFIYGQITQYINGNLPNMTLSTVGMDQEEKPLTQKISNFSEFEELVNNLYETPIHIENEIDYIHRYGENQARGLKIHIVDKSQNIDIYLDPSIARFCFGNVQLEEFLKLIKNAFNDTPEDEKASL